MTKRWTRGKVVDALIQLSDYLEARPTQIHLKDQDLRKQFSLPSLATVYKLFGNWHKAMEAAGLTDMPRPKRLAWECEPGSRKFFLYSEVAGRRRYHKSGRICNLVPVVYVDDPVVSLVCRWLRGDLPGPSEESIRKLMGERAFSLLSEILSGKTLREIARENSLSITRVRYVVIFGCARAVGWFAEQYAQAMSRIRAA